MNFIMSNRKQSNLKEFGEISYLGDILISGEFLVYFKGFIFPHDYKAKEILDIYLDKGIEILKSFTGEFTIVIYNSQKNELVIINDKIGRNDLFIYKKNEILILSDNFWEIIDIIKPDMQEIDEEAVKEWAYLFFPLNDKTIVNNLDYFPSASIGSYSFTTEKLDITKYWNFSDVKIDETISEDEISDIFYRKIDEGIKFIKKKHGEDKIYGCSVSGGLDSRLTPHFCLKNDMKILSFCISDKARPRLFILSRIHHIVNKITKYYGIRHFFINSAKSKIKDKVDLEIKNYPLGSTNIRSTVNSSIPDFDIHLNAGGPEMMSTTITGVEKVGNKEEFSSYIIDKLSIVYRNTIKKKKSFFSKVFNAFTENKSSYSANRVSQLSDDDLSRIKKKIESYYCKNGSVVSYYTYLYHQIASKTGSGAFESLTGTKTSYSIFFPFVTDFLISVKPELMINRKILKGLLLDKFPELSKIPCEHDLWGIAYENQEKSSLKNKFLIFDQKLRTGGNSGMHLMKKKNKKELKSFFDIENDFFFNIFDKSEILSIAETNWNLYLQLVKIKAVLDVVYHKKWKEYK